MISSQWHIVALNAIMFISFLIPLSYRSRASWKQSGIATAFFISLFVEMYGIPFTILFAAKTINPTHIELIEATSISFAGVDFIFTIPMVYGSIMMLAGALVIAYGWITLYNKGKNGILVTGGIYSFSRHPQYLGFILLILGWMIGWPTFMTLILGSILIAVYIRVCKKEEKELSREYNYDTYKKSTPFMI